LQARANSVVGDYGMGEPGRFSRSSHRVEPMPT
jgi:hypothetical protein